MRRPGATFTQRIRATTWVALAALGALAVAAPRAAAAAALALTATIGIAHGATDAAVLDRAGVRPRGGPATISIGYGVLAIAVFLVARRRPALASRALGIVSWAHFGSGDAAFARACGSRRPEVPEAFVRGGVPLLIGGRDARSAWATVTSVGFAAIAVALDDLAEAVDVVLPALVLYAAPSRLGFGCYFGAWHAPRHLALLLERDPRGGPYGARFVRFAREAAPNSAIAAAFAALAYAFRQPSDSMDDLAPALILAITIPHQLAVWTVEFASRRSALEIRESHEKGGF
jgi:hypothetical protein